MSEVSAPVAGWVCPFCALACDHLDVQIGQDDEPLALRGGDCPRARSGLQTFASRSADVSPTIDGRNASLDDAVAAAARQLAASRQPLFAGLGTDVAGARALYRLACACGAICDGAGGDAAMHVLRALQDRGQFTTTLAEVRTRADLIVFVGSLPTDLAPLLAQRCGIGEAQLATRHLVVLHPRAGDAAALAAMARNGVSVESIAPDGDLFTTLAQLNATLARPASSAVPAQPSAAGAALHALAERLRRASYAVFIGAPLHLPAHGALIVEAVQRLIGRLNAGTRAAALWLDGGNGAATVNQVFAWLSGLPLRSRAGPRGLEHEPFAFGAARLLEGAAVDLLMWVSSFDAAALPPPCTQPLLVLGHPAQASACARRDAVFIPVATPGIGADGHVFRTDGSVLMPLRTVRPDALPGVAEVAQWLLRARRGLSQP
jgi:formylmethanofuran dehydrogenase subunit B